MNSKTQKTFEISKDPFDKEIDDNDIWLPSSKKVLVNNAVDALNARQHLLLTGEPGAGKTVVLRAIRNALPQTRFRLTYVHNATLGRRDFYRQLCAAIGLHTKATPGAVFAALHEYVVGLAREQKQHPVFFLDESHLLKDDLLDHLHIVQNYGWDSQPVLSLVLIGLPELRERLNRHRYRSLMSRIHRRLIIDDLKPEDTAEYLRHRMSLAGCKRDHFPPDALAVLHEKTHGLLRDIDRIASLALQVAAHRGTKTIHKDVMLEAINSDNRGGLIDD